METDMNCGEFDENPALYLYNELEAEQRHAFETHLAVCAPCRTLLEETRRLHGVLAERPASEPSPELLVQCRSALEDALDRELSGVSWKSLSNQWSSAFGWMSRIP